MKAHNKKRKLEVFQHYAAAAVPFCKCCGENNLQFLTIDHIRGGGNKHRKEIFGTYPSGGSAMYWWLKKNNMPAGFQVLCFNCNCAKGFHGYCPHQQFKPAECDPGWTAFAAEAIREVLA